MNGSQTSLLSAQRRIMLVFVLSAVVSIILVGGALRFFLQRAALAQSRTYIESQANMLARQCESEIEEAQHDLEFVSKMPAFQQLSCVDRIDLVINGVPENVDVEKRRILMLLMNKAERFSVLYVLRPNADMYLEQPFQSQLALQTYNLSGRPYFKEAVRTRKTVISDGLLGSGGKLTVAIIVPIFAESGEVTGYLGGAIYLNKLSQLVSPERIRPFDAGFIIDRTRSLIAHTNTELLQEGVREHFIEQHPFITEFIVSADSSAENKQGEVVFGECEGSERVERHLTALIRLQSGWSLGLMRNRESVIAESRPVIWKITTLASLLLAAISALAVIIAQRIGRRWHGAEQEIHKLNAELEQRVIERTAQLEASNKELEAFAYSVSHDLRAPLRSVDGFSRIVLEEYGSKLDAEGMRLLNVVRSSTQQMDKLITDLLTISRVTRTEMRLSRIDMTALAQLIYYEVASPEVQARFEFSVAPLPVAFGDSTLLQQVWVNLLDNAVKYTQPKDKRSIKVGGYTDQDMNIYFVKDTGVGFDPQYTHKLFGVFQRLHKASEFEGTGIGLATVQRIVHRHGGRVWAEGKINEGATFYFAIPISNRH